MMDKIELALAGSIDGYGEWTVGIALIVFAIGLIVTAWYLLISRPERGLAKSGMTPIADPEPQQNGDTASSSTPYG